MPESWRIVRLVDDRGTDAQRQALLRAFRGELGGPLASLAHLVGEEVAVETVPISHTVSSGFGKLSIPGLLETDVEPFRGPDGSVTTLRDGISSTVLGAPAWVAKASMLKVCLPATGWSGSTARAMPSRPLGVSSISAT